MPKLIVINKRDKDEFDFYKTFGELKEKFGNKLVPFSWFFCRVEGNPNIRFDFRRILYSCISVFQLSHGILRFAIPVGKWKSDGRKMFPGRKAPAAI